MNNRRTRGNGLLENLLAKKRAEVAKSLIPQRLLNGRLLDIGCGSYPYFLSKINFTEKFALDKEDTRRFHDIKYFNADLNNIEKLPFNDEFFDVVTALAVMEHLDPSILPKTVKEVRRILKKKGLFILTTPAGWTDRLLNFLAKINLVSKQEISEHKSLFNSSELKTLLTKAGFRNVRTGNFELFMNLFAVAEK
ncbi:MAG: class I SAM-dependent methyltransferase [Candidatus Margulisiibacteriota bacterium]